MAQEQSLSIHQDLSSPEDEKMVPQFQVAVNKTYDAEGACHEHYLSIWVLPSAVLTFIKNDTAEFVDH